MSVIRDGIPSAPGIVIAPARVLRWEVPRVPHGITIAHSTVDAEIERFRDACEWVKERIRELQGQTVDAMGTV